VKIALELPGRTLYAVVWRVEVGRVTLYLMDTEVTANTPQDREITGQLYTADPRKRIEQEILLGVGGARLLRLLGIRPAVYHLNEGHSAFLILENIRQAMNDFHMSFDEAREYVRASTVFTTHTPVDAGNERFDPELVRHYFAQYIREAGISADEFLGLGRIGLAADEPFTMTVLALKSACASNGVSRLHGRVARKMWQSVWPGVPRSMIPISHVTNGVHVATFLGPEMRAALDTYLGVNWLSEDIVSASVWDRLDGVPDEILWNTKMEMKQRLMAYVKDRIAATWSGAGGQTEISIEEVFSRLHSSALTIGFARRFAPYKRASLLFQDPDRLARILTNPRRPVQLIFAGKAHPNDQAGCDLVAEVVKFARDPRFAGYIVFLEDYDLNAARLLVQGVDVWLNTPRRPFEASGTSGQKAAINAGINLSVADGWWWEGATGDNGWVIGAPPEEADEETISNDFQEAAQLYALIEDTIVPLYYQRNARGLPEGWLAMMRRSLRTVTGYFNSYRMLIDYWNGLYVLAAQRGARFKAAEGKRARELAAWKKRAGARFSSVQILDIRTTGLQDGAIQLGRPFSVAVRLDLGEMTADEIHVEMIVGKADPVLEVRDPQIVVLRRASGEGENERTALFEGSYTATDKGNYVFGIRIVPWHEDLCDPTDTGLVVWA